MTLAETGTRALIGAVFGTPLAGAVFDVMYDSANNGTFDEDLGSCTTTATGSCSPEGNDGADGLLPGRYQVTETGAPTGYALPSPAAQVIDLLAGESGVVSFGDSLLVSTVFHKMASGNVNPAELVLSGAVIQVDQGTPGGRPVAQCATDSSGTCVTTSNLVSGTHYCWVELAAPRGLAGGANGGQRHGGNRTDQSRSPSTGAQPSATSPSMSIPASSWPSR